MAVAAVMTAAGCGGAGAARSLSRFRGCLAGALLGDCVGAVYEARDTVDLTSVLRRVQDLEPDPGSPGSARTGGRGRAHWAPGSSEGLGQGGDSGRRGPICTTRGHLGFSVSKSEPRLHTSRPERLPARGLATQTAQPFKPRLDCA